MVEQPRIIIIKKKGGHAVHHGGAWKVAYADFVTAMMAFFLVMWILGLSQESRKSIAAYFNDPSGMMKTHGGGKNPMNVGRESSKRLPTLVMSVQQVRKNQVEETQFKEAKKELEDMVKSLPKFKELQKHVEITVSAEGLRIELLEDKQGLFFETGSANMNIMTIELLKMVGRSLAKLPHQIVVEGHTDARPYAGGNKHYTNWKLSSERANAALEAIEPTVQNHQITEVRGYADSRLRKPDDPYHFSNRRISVLVPSTQMLQNVPTEVVGGNSADTIIKPLPVNLKLNGMMGPGPPKPHRIGIPDEN